MDGTEEGNTSYLVRSLEDIDNDGLLELICYPSSSNIHIYGGNNGSYTEKSNISSASLSTTATAYRVTHDPTEKYPSYYIQYGPPLVGDVSNDGVKELLVKSGGALVAYDVSIASPIQRWSYTYPSGTSVYPSDMGDVDNDGENETLVHVTDGTLVILDENGNAQTTIQTARRLYEPLVADLDNDGTNEIIVQGASNDMQVIDASIATLASPPTEVNWSYNGSYYESLGSKAVLADLDGDGDKEIVLRTASSFLEVLNHDGSRNWNYSGSISYLGTGDFNSDSIGDVFVADYYHDFHVFDGTNGSQIWGIDKPSSWIPATADTNNDGIDDIVAIQASNHVLAYNGSDGATLWDTSGTCALCNDGTIIVGDLDGDGINELVTTGNMGNVAYELNGSVLWQQRETSSEGNKDHYGCLMDVDNDGALDLVQPSNHGIYAFNGTDGSELWHFYPDPKVAVSSTVVADIDGDLSEEIIFSANDGYLYALNEEDGSLAWRFYFGYQLGSPIVADTDNDSEAEILVASNGYLYCLDKDQPTVSGIHSGRSNTIYQDGTIAYSTYPNGTSTEVDLNVTPSANTVYVTIETWNTSGTYYKKWNESSASSSITTNHTVGDLEAGKWYLVKIDNQTWQSIQSNSTGHINFTYDQGYSVKTFEVEEDTGVPTVNLILSTDTVSVNGILNFTYNVSDDSAISNCSLLIDGAMNQTGSSITRDTTQNFTINLPAGRYNWSINCTDVAENQGASEARVVIVIKTTEFSGNTTDLTQVNASNITNLVIDQPDYGMINFSQTIDLSIGADIDAYVNISQNRIEVNSIALPALSKNATLYIRNLSYDNPTILRDGVGCSSAICTKVSYSGGTLAFNVTHFSNYSATEGNNLSINDSVDNGLTMEIDEQVTFYASYTFSNNTVVDSNYNSVCQIKFNDTGTWSSLADMIYNSTSQVYWYNRSFNETGTYYYNVSCNSSIVATHITALDDVVIGDLTDPTTTLAFPANNTGDSDGNATFSYNVSDLNAVSNCSLIVNEAVNQTDANVAKDTLQNFTLTDVPVGQYNWSVNCTDAAGNEGASETRSLSVTRATQYTGNTTDLSQVNMWNITSLVIEKPNQGKINFTDSVDLSGGGDINTYVNITHNMIEINSSALPSLDRNATLYLYNLTYMNPRVLRDGLVCQPEICTRLSYSGGTLAFSVIGFSAYSSEETYGSSCVKDSDCPNGYCVHDICRSEATYCGDGICDSGEISGESKDRAKCRTLG